MTRYIYLDWNATTPPHRDVLAAMAEAAERTWANPASIHSLGRRARSTVETAREAVADLAFGYCSRDVIFTSGGTEANNLALVRPFIDERGELRSEGGTLITSRIEHPSVTRVAEWLESRGLEVAWLPVSESGALDPAAVRDALARAARGAPRLVAVQAVNHETGVVQPLAAIAAAAADAGAELHVDAVQAVGRLAPASWQGGDTMSIASHKIRGPKAIGALCTRPGAIARPILRGGTQERGFRPGTVDPVAAAGFGAAARRALDGGANRYAALAPLRDRLERELVEAAARAGTRALVNGTGLRAPHVTNLSIAGWPSDELVAALDLEGLAVSAGSACAAGTAELSPVITAMSGAERARGAIRFSLGEETTSSEVEATIAAWSRVLTRSPSSR